MDKIAVGDITFLVRTEIDEDPDLSWMGEYTSSPTGEVYIDRQERILVSKYESWERVVTPQEARTIENGVRATLNARYSHDMPSVAELAALSDDARWAYDRLLLDSQYDSWDRYDYDDGTVAISYDGRRVLRGNLYSRYERGEYRYYVPGNHLPHDPKNWEHVLEEVKAKIIAEFGCLENADIHCAIEDYERMERYGHLWNMVGVIVEAHKGSVSLGRNSLWGIEDDTDYWKEVAVDLVSAVVRGIPNGVARLERQVSDLKAVVLDENEVLAAIKGAL